MQWPPQDYSRLRGPHKLSKYCEVYPAELCDALLLALKQQLEQEQR